MASLHHCGCDAHPLFLQGTPQLAAILGTLLADAPPSLCPHLVRLSQPDAPCAQRFAASPKVLANRPQPERLNETAYFLAFSTLAARLSLSANRFAFNTRPSQHLTLN
jgi:hypothetical protein